MILDPTLLKRFIARGVARLRIGSIVTIAKAVTAIMNVARILAAARTQSLTWSAVFVVGMVAGTFVYRRLSGVKKTHYRDAKVFSEGLFHDFPRIPL